MGQNDGHVEQCYSLCARPIFSASMDIIDKYRSLTIEENRYLIHRVSGKSLKLNGTASFFLDMQAAGWDKREVCAKASEFFGVSIEQVSADLDKFLDSLHESDSKAVELHSLESALLDKSTDVICEEGAESKIYRVGGIEFKIFCSDSKAQQLIGTLFSSLKVSRSERKLIEIGLYDRKNGWSLTCGGRLYDDIFDAEFLTSRLREVMIEQLTLEGIHRLGVHAAAVLTPDGRALLFPAPSGSGKSTLSTYLALNGCGYLGDDGLVLDLDLGEVVPFPTAAKLDQVSIDALGLTDGVAGNSAIGLSNTVYSSDGKKEQLINLVAGTSSDDSYAIKALIFPKFELNSEVELRQLDASEVFSRIEESGLYAFQGISADTAEAHIKFFSETEAYALSFSDMEQARAVLLSRGLL